MRALPLLVLLATEAALTPQRRDAMIDALFQLPAPPAGNYADYAATAERAAVRPADDATLEDLVAWWSMNAYNDKASPPARVSERLVDAIEKQPESVDDVLEYFPPREDVCQRVRKLKRLSDRAQTWLLHHCSLEHELLVEKAAAAKDEAGWVTNAEDLDALARADWNRAEPLIRQFSASPEPRRRALALAIQYEHAPTDANRAALEEVALDVTAPGSARNRAFEALGTTFWAGRDEWFLARMTDPTLLVLRDGSFGFSPIENLVQREPDSWIPVMTKLLRSADRTTRSLAANALAQFNLKSARADAIRPLVPWISDRSFADEHSMNRLRIIQSVAALGMAEAVPHLREVVVHDPNDNYRAYAAQALAQFHETAANPEMREAAERPSELGSGQDILVTAIVANGGYSAAEMASGVESFLRHSLTMPNDELSRITFELGRSLPTSEMLGRHVVKAIHDRDDVASILIVRANQLEPKEPAIAAALRETVQKWPVPSSDAFVMERIEAGTAEPGMIVAALSRRESFRETSAQRLHRLAAGSGVRAGLAAVLLGDRQLETRLLAGSDAEAQRGLLAASRLVREPLPIEAVSALFGKSSSLDEAAESWLVAEDSAMARAIVQRRHPNEILILGAEGYEDWEQTILRAFRRSNDDEVIALAVGGPIQASSRLEIRIRRNEAVLISARGSHTLDAGELAEIRAVLEAVHADDLGPIQTGTYDASDYEYLHLTRSFGRRVWMNHPQTFSGSPHAELVRKLMALLD